MSVRMLVSMTIFLIVTTLTSVGISQSSSDILLPDLGHRIGTCPVCGMDVYEKMLTRVDIKTSDSVYHACALGCASAFVKDHPDAAVEVYDAETGYFGLNGLEAFYLFGSRIIPVRAMLPELSFGNKYSAEHYQKIYGGTILFGKDAFETALQIRRERTSVKAPKK